MTGQGKRAVLPLHPARDLLYFDHANYPPPLPVIPAQAGIQCLSSRRQRRWIPAFAGMTG